MASPTSSALRAVWGTGPADVWFVGDASQNYHWDGCSFVPYDNAAGAPLRAIWGSGADDIWAVGDKGTMVHYSQGLWRNVAAAGAPYDLRAIHGASATDIWAVGTHGTVLRWSRAPSSLG